MPQKTLNIINRISLSFFLVVVLDFLFFGGYIKKSLPSSVEHISWYYFIFSFPHILAPFVAYFSKDYIGYYKNELIKGFSINIFIILLFMVFLPDYFIYFFVLYTMYHVAWQQIGMCRKFIKNELLYFFWSRSGVLSVVFIAMSIGGERQIYVPGSVSPTLQSVGVVFMFLFALFSINISSKDEYVITTSLNIFLAAIAILFGYPIIGILMTRFAHDISAFSIYIKHDFLKQSKNGLNYVYDLFRIKSKYIFVFLPVFSLFVSFILQSLKFYPVYIFIYFLSLMHYYLEGIVWKGGTLHRVTLI